LIVKDEVLGIISLYTKMEHEFTGEEVEFFSTLAGQAAIAIHNARLYAEARTREAQLQGTNRMLSALHAVAAAASRLPDLDRVLRLAIEKIRDIFRFDTTRIHIYDERADELVLRAAFDSNPGHSTSAQFFRRGEGIVGKVAESGKPLIFEDVQTDPLYRELSRTKASDQFGYRFFAGFPIKGKLTNLGTLSCVGTAPRKLGSGEIQLLEAITERIGVAIENSELYEQLRQKVNELQQKTVELERANKVKDEFLSLISHELRTPLTVIIGYLGMIKDRILGEINQEQERALERVMIRANDQLAMIISILHATQIEAEEVKVESYEVSLGDFLQHLKSLYELPLGKEVALNWDYPSDLPVVKTDGEKLKNILQNLINNAIKFTEKGWVKISARCLDSKVAEFKVADTGIGIEKEFFVVIFDRFRQVDSSETRPYGGVGVGLYIVKQYTELLGGKVEVESEVGKGSTFTVTIPCEIFPLAVGEQQLSAESKGLNA
jgi:signal transduction histidine kinase